MKNFYTFTLLLLPFLSLKTTAQVLDISNLKLDIQEIIPIKNKGFVVFKADNPDQPFLVELSFFDTNMELISSKSIETYQEGEIFSVEKIFIWNEKLIMHGAHYLPDSKKNQLFQYSFSLPNLELLDKTLILLSKAKNNIYVPYFSKLSPDKTKLVVLGWDYNKPKEQAYVRVRVLDKNLKEIRRQSYLFPYENRRISIEEVFVDNEGMVYITGNNYNGSLLSEVRLARIDHFVVGLFKGEKIKQWEIQKDKHYFQGFQYLLTQKGDLIGMGLCEKNDYQGSAFFQLNSSTDTITVNAQSIGKSAFEKAFTNNSKFLNPPKRTFNDYQLQKVIRRVDAYYLISEFQEYTYFEDILVLKLDLNGFIKWAIRIPKNQDVSFVDDVFSYTLIEQKEKFYFLFNDHIANYQQEEIKDMESATVLKAQLAVAMIDLSTGILKRSPVEGVINKDFIFLPYLSQLFAKEHAVIMAKGILDKTNSFQVEKIKFPE